MTTTSLLSLLMSDTTRVGPPDSCDPAGDKLSHRNISGSLASFKDYGNCSFPIENKLTIARQEQPEPPPYSYSPDAYDTEIYSSASATRIEVDEPPLDAYSPDTHPIATPTMGNTRSSTRHPDWSGWYGVAGRSSSTAQQYRTKVISPIDWAGSPLTSSSIAALEREYDRDTWRLFRRIQQARSLQQKQPPPDQLQQLEGVSRLQLNQRMVSEERLAGEEFEDEELHRARMATDEEDEEIMFAMD